jgi:hypothetical protein
VRPAGQEAIRILWVTSPAEADRNASKSGENVGKTYGQIISIVPSRSTSLGLGPLKLFKGGLLYGMGGRLDGVDFFNQPFDLIS